MTAITLAVTMHADSSLITIAATGGMASSSVALSYYLEFISTFLCRGSVNLCGCPRRMVHSKRL